MNGMEAGRILTANDDLLGHQTSASFAEVSIEDTRSAIFTERFWYMGATVPDRQLVFGFGLGYYPNRGVMDCYAAVTFENRQYNIRASRRTYRDQLRPAVGPLSIETSDPMARHRITLEPNGADISLDLTFSAFAHPNDEGRDVTVHRERVVADVRRFVQAGNFAGRIDIAGRRFDLEAGSTIGFRDRSWGLRAEARTDESTPPVSRFPAILYAFLCVRFETHSLHLFWKETAPGDFKFLAGNETGPLGGPGPDGSRAATRIDHDLAWSVDAPSQVIDGGTISVQFRDGTGKTLTVRSLDRRLFLKGGLYGGLAGWFQGDPKGELHVEHDVWDLADPETRRITRTLAEQLVEVRDGNALGYGTLQCGVGAGYPGYREIQHLPAQ